MLIARTMRAERQVAAEMRSAVQDLDARLPVYSSASLNELLSFTYLPVRAAVTSLGAFGLLAILLSITGIYGVAAYNVSRRQREIGALVPSSAPDPRVYGGIRFNRLFSGISPGHGRITLAGEVSPPLIAGLWRGDA